MCLIIKQKNEGFPSGRSDLADFFNRIILALPTSSSSDSASPDMGGCVPQSYT